MTFDVTLEAAPEDTCWLTLASSPGAGPRARRDAWLGTGPIAGASPHPGQTSTPGRAAWP
jgi:hypothetical protein